MLSPSSSISHLSNTNSNKKFKADTTDSTTDNNTTSQQQQENTNKNKLLNGIMKNIELNDVTNNTNENNNCKYNGGEQKLNGASHKTIEDVNKCDQEKLIHDSEYIQNGNKSIKAEIEDENDCEMIDETEVKSEIQTETIKESHLNGTESNSGTNYDSSKEATAVIDNAKTPIEELSDKEQIKKQLEKLNQLAEIDVNNNSELFRSRRTAFKHAKAQKLKQLQIDLKNEEAKLILLKRLYYSQRIASQPANQQQQLLKQQQLQQQQKAQQIKKSATLVNQGLSDGLTNGLQGQRQSIMNNKPQSNQLAQTNRMSATSASVNNTTQPRPVNQNFSNNLTKANNLTNNMQRNPSTTQIINTNSNRNNSLNRQGNSGTASPVNNGNTKASSLMQNSASTVSPSSAFSPKIPEKVPVVSQAAVSQLVRKELEKSLAQIEFPKPPAQDIYFLPNTNNSEFLMCLGLEEVAKCVQEHLIHKQIKAEVKEQQQANESDAPKIVKSDTVIEIVYEYPLFCAQCNTDFTPVWRTDKNGLTLCEKCLKQLEKKQIKTEHNARLKQAFLKAVKDKEVFEKQLISEQQKQLELQRAQRAANPSPVMTNSNINTSINNSNSHDRVSSNSSHQQRSSSSTQGRLPSNTPTSINNNNPGRGFNSATQVNSINPSGNTNNTNSMSRQQQQIMQQRRSLQNNQGSSITQNKSKGGISNQMPGKSVMNNNVGNNSMKTNSNGNNPNRSIGNISGNHHLQNQQNHSSMQQNKHKSDQMQSTSRVGQTSSQSNTNSQRQRQSIGNVNNSNSQQVNNQKSFSSRSNSNLDNTTDVTAAQLQAQAAQLQLAAAFANTPALAAFAQQQQQQQQAAILQRLMQNAGAGGFNPLQSLGLGSPASAALNYLNMFPNQRKNP